MQNDEHAIRTLVNDWQVAAAEGNLQRLSEMMAEDVVFLTPGQAPLRGREAFMEAFQEGLKHYRIESQGEIKELHVTDDLAYCWTHLTVTVTPHHEGRPMRRSGNTLSILKKRPDTGWVIVRDANMLTAEPVYQPA
ncbi:MAG TPA: SgcJ/EcaC family oxidoreductase [Noviherbaspirillum sp.]|uniref:YybH family protein n=1 Tax=Noviherbaspirillum sp. TaxID=1926288 RepID=UPI002D27EF72|nr:SgcJ/EcaC family oxidoreductase [Noviherbaspirillum sp.]HYD93726.1 SgcJ/EcaC family oxidoreductase [Noviherbaspirillum sp.]